MNKYIEEIEKHSIEVVPNDKLTKKTSEKSGNRRILGGNFINSFNHARSNKFMRVMEDIFFC